MDIVIIDDDFLVTTSLKTILESDPDITVKAIGHSAKEAVSLYQQEQPDILLMDIRMGTSTGIDAAKDILHSFPCAKILFLTTFLDDEYIIEALQIGAKGYLLKQAFNAIIPALKAVQNGQSVFGDQIIDKMPHFLNQAKYQTAQTDLSIQLSSKEKELLECIIQGLDNKEIARQLFLSEGTIRNYISQLLDKFDCKNRTQLAIKYFQIKK